MMRSGRVAAAMAGLVLLSGCATPPGAAPAPATSTAPPPANTVAASASASASAGDAPDGVTAQPGTVTCEYATFGEPARPVDPPPTRDVRATGMLSVTLNMSEGPIVISMDRSKAPCTVNSFESLAKQGFYDGTSCHRLVDQGVYFLQCGDPTGTGRGGPGYRVADELTGAESYPAGVVAMANDGPGTGGSQFFIVWADSELEPNSTIFGTIDEASLGVVTTIASRGVSGDHSPSPISPAKIEQVSLG